MAVHTPSTELGRLIGDALGPLPRVAAESVLLDLERARMGREDHRALCQLIDDNDIAFCESIRSAKREGALQHQNNLLLRQVEVMNDAQRGLRAANRRAEEKCEDLLERIEKTTAMLEGARDSVYPIAYDPHANHDESLLVIGDQITKAITQLGFDADMSESDDSDSDDAVDNDDATDDDATDDDAEL